MHRPGSCDAVLVVSGRSFVAATGGGHGRAAGLPGLSTAVPPVVARRAGGQAVARGGRWSRWTAVWRSSQAACQGQVWGRCSVTRRALRAIRAGTLMRWARIVAVVARAWKAPARVPAARVRLWEIAHSTVHAAF